MKVLCVMLMLLPLLVGCGGSLEKKVVGSWKADISKSDFSNAGKTEADKKMAEEIMKTVTLELKEDKSFELVIMFPLKGTWSLNGNKLSLKPAEGEKASFGGKDSMDFEVDSSGSVLTFTSPDPKMPGKLALVKSS
ncbi:MAG: hypothetical protein J0H02_15765 [Armatimonadetes bacterium]|nr:hypothetical protein [Armatimonadota bacterium]